MCPTAIGNFALTTQNFFELKQLSRFSIRWQQLLRTYDFERARVPPKQYARSEISFLCEVIATGSNGGIAPGDTLDSVFLHLRTHFPEGAHYLGQCNITHEQTYITIYILESTGALTRALDSHALASGNQETSTCRQTRTNTIRHGDN